MSRQLQVETNQDQDCLYIALKEELGSENEALALAFWPHYIGG